MNRARFQPRRPLTAGVVLAVIALVGFRVWQLTADQAPEKLDAGEYRVESVTDGDTLRLANGARVRLIGVDTPETKLPPRSGGDDQPFALDAKAFTIRATEHRDVRLEIRQGAHRSVRPLPGLRLVRRSRF